MAISSTEKILEGFERIKEGVQILGRGPMSHYLEELIACHQLLVTRFTPFRVGDKVRLTKTPVIDGQNSHGWIPYKKNLVAGVEGTISAISVGCGGFVFDVIIPLGGTVTGNFSFKEDWLAFVDPYKVQTQLRVTKKETLLNTLAESLDSVEMTKVNEISSGNNTQSYVKLMGDNQEVVNLFNLLNVIRGHVN